VFIVYVAGADEPQQVTLPPGATKTILFKNVADFGNMAQAVVAMWGKYRWFTPGVDVRAAQTVKAPVFGISGDGIDLLGAFRPVWRQDGSRVSYRSGVCTLNSASVAPTPGEHEYLPLFGGKNPMGTCAWDLGPTAATANQLLYSENSEGDSGIYRITEGGKHPGEKLTTYCNIPYQILFDLRWLPDGSGFLFSNQTLMRDSETSSATTSRLAKRRRSPDSKTNSPACSASRLTVNGSCLNDRSRWMTIAQSICGSPRSTEAIRVYSCAMRSRLRGVKSSSPNYLPLRRSSLNCARL
jgi:hypothetical protein